MIDVHFVYLGASMSVLGTVAYLRDTLLGTTQPNRVTWLLWALAPLLAFAVEIGSGVGLRALPTFMFGLMPLLVFIASFHNPAAVWKIGRLDYVCGALSLGGTVGWLVTRSGTAGIVVAIVADFLAAVPTLRKSWTHPESETLIAYFGAMANSTLLLLTVVKWTIAVVAFPLYILCVASVEIFLIGTKPGPRYLVSRERRKQQAVVPIDS
jgi:hypothetical protein